MSKLVLHIVFLFISLSLWTQENLVPNGSFEEYNWCPNTANGFYINSCKYWTSPTLGTPDYFNSCSTEYDITLQRFLFSVPENYIGNQAAHTGNAYSFFTFGQNDSNSLTYSENIQIKLNHTLDAGRFYEVSFFVHNPIANYCINSIGALFTPNQLNLNTDEILPYNPQFLSNPDVFFCDTNNWYQVKGTFIAQGTEEYMTIGVFKSLPELKVKDYNGNFLNGLSAAIYIDDVYLKETELQISNIFTPNGDGLNDYYHLNLKGIGAKKAEIYNRWGNLIFQCEDTLNWDGTFNGIDCTEGVYFIRIIFEDNNVNGFIHLMK
ncbi:gliding motility-associated C-terminal domain-containing protein [Fluviicola taffensis]|uniref:Gliding motility-associated C-terminal domain-containing protein n=1 Tax=Fluviicola taffensis (strain DSM 16823 / NCIMB 13979 / RW262) TaxID=755732 RepID=F2IGP5_FLUTR|nr:gliding motility-associated C-terminal domain-containing protein [Fluviicola taffensis]AEA43662.1 hypothetical protein Fluta_1670 [Fluviicola taffensis DSM 16823]